MISLLIVDDEPALIAVLEPVLSAAGYSVATAASASAAIRALESFEPDAILLDLGLPDRDGHSVIGEVRSRSDVPIIVISARHQETEKIAALDGGADDYVNKPFEIGELTARIRAATRRHANQTARAGRFAGGPLAIDFGTRTVTLEGDAVKMSPKEFEILKALALSACQVVTHRKLLAAGWGDEKGDGQYLRVYIGLLRQKLEAEPSEPKLILTEPGVGYRLAVP